jgi:threonine synthase
MHRASAAEVAVSVNNKGDCVMRYISTRGKVAPMGFIDAVLMGMADDGGLLVPEQIPSLSAEDLRRWAGLSYRDLAVEIFWLYANQEISRKDLTELVDDSYRRFRDEQVTPLGRLDENRYVAELFHGPTFAFKDIALQFLGNLYAYVAHRTNSVINILGATSGDTGASAVEGVRGKPGIRICILYPHQKVSRVQELQMTTVNDSHVLNLAVQGTFDDCQRIIKEIFAEVEFKRRYHLRAVNSINMARILAQTVYYFYAYFRLVEAEPGKKVSFSVPTGNFGNLFAGYLAKKMGLPIHRFILATNENNILERYVREGVYQPSEFHRTYSPSMDIQIASNFERYLYYLYGENPETVDSIMAEFRAHGRIVSSPSTVQQVQTDFSAYSVGNEECLETIAAYHQHYGYVVDPHTACAAAAAEKLGSEREATVILATAHPAKFNEALALRGILQGYPKEIEQLFDLPETKTVVECRTEVIQDRLVHFLA